MVTRLRHLSVLQLALVLAVLYALIGILIGLAWWLIISPIMMTAAKSGPFAGAAEPPAALP